MKGRNLPSPRVAALLKRLIADGGAVDLDFYAFRKNGVQLHSAIRAGWVVAAGAAREITPLGREYLAKYEAANGCPFNKGF